MKQSPILVLDDDEDDLLMIRECFKQLDVKRPVLYFTSGPDLISYLSGASEAPIIIISDLNLPGKDGFEVKEQIEQDEELKYKGVPFIIWSTNASEKQIKQAYDLSAQGFFFKPTDFNALCDTLETILKYWQKSQHPKQVK